MSLQERVAEIYVANGSPCLGKCGKLATDWVAFQVKTQAGGFKRARVYCGDESCKAVILLREMDQ